MNAHTDPWPDDVTARYLTVAGATVDLRDCDDDGGAQTATCTGCRTRYRHGRRVAQEWAQAHAEKCRALPRPTA